MRLPRRRHRARAGERGPGRVRRARDAARGRAAAAAAQIAIRLSPAPTARRWRAGCARSAPRPRARPRRHHAQRALPRHPRRRPARRRARGRRSSACTRSPRRSPSPRASAAARRDPAGDRRRRARSAPCWPAPALAVARARRARRRSRSSGWCSRRSSPRSPPATPTLPLRRAPAQVAARRRPACSPLGGARDALASRRRVVREPIVAGLREESMRPARRWSWPCARSLAGCGGDGRAARRRGSTLTRTLVDRDGDGVLEPGPGEPLRDRTELAPRGRRGARRSRASRSSPTPTCATRSRPRACRSSTASAAPLSATFRPQEALTAQVLDAAVRSLNARAPAGRARHRRPARQRAGATSSTQRLAVLDGGARAARLAARPATAACRQADNPDPLLLPPRRRRAAPPGLLAARPARRSARPASTRPGTRRSATTTCSSRASCRRRRRIDALATGDRALLTFDPTSRPARRCPARGRDAGPRASAVAAVLARRAPAAARASVPADPAAPAARPAPRSLRAARPRPGAAGGPPLDYTFDLGAAVRAHRARHRRPRRRRARRRSTPAQSPCCATRSPRPATATSWSSPTTALDRVRRRRGGARAARRRPARRRRDRRPPPPQRDPPRAPRPAATG